MIPASLRLARTPNTKLYLNGPILSIVTNPSGVTTSVGNTVSISGFATATFDQNSNGVLDGNIVYQWYNSSTNLPLVEGSKYVGTATSTLTINNTESPQDHFDVFFVRAQYEPKDTGGNLNEPIAGNAYGTVDSNNATLEVIPTITITTQPVSQTIGEGETVTFTATASISDTRYNLEYYWTVDGIIQSNSNSTSISLTKSSIGTEKVQFHAYTTICPSGSDTGGRVTCKNYITSSNEVDFIGVAPRSIVKFEAFATDNSYSSQEVNLDDGDFTLLDTVFGTNYNIITFYAKEKDIPLELTLKASKGSNKGSFNGGEGGVSTISLTLQEDVEYTLLGVTDNSAIFLYKGSELYAVVGQGGSAGTSGNGGNGGGMGLAGANASGGSGPGTGGPVDSLSLNGIFGSVLSSVTLQSGDSLATSPDGGRTISCTKGSYWIDQGISPCSNNSTSNIKFVNTDGTEITSSDEIIRGFKPGYTITTTAGQGVDTPSVDSGNGGNGASGGEGGTNGSGGGGGSGYTGGSVQVISTSSGGNSSNKSSVVFSIS